MDVLPALKTYLLGPGNLADAVEDQARETFRGLVEDRVFLARYPQPRDARDLHVVLANGGGDPTYGINGEIDVTETIVDVDFIQQEGDDRRAQRNVRDCYEAFRKVVTKFRGSWTQPNGDSIEVQDVQRFNSPQDRSTPSKDGSDEWVIWLTCSFRIMHEQEVAAWPT